MVHHHRLRDQLSPQTATESAGEEAVAVQGHLTQAWRTAANLMAERPKTSLIAALAAGVVVGWIIKRR